MKHRTLIVSVAALAAVGLVAVLAVAVVVRVTGSDPAAGAPPLESPAAPGLLAALQRDLGLTEEQARQRLHTEAWAGRTSAALRDQLGPQRYAGSWLDQDANQLTVAVTDDAAAELVREAGAEPQLVARPGDYLGQVLAALDQHADEIVQTAQETIGWVAGWYVDASENQVVVHAPAEAEPLVRDLSEAVGELSEAVQIVFSEERPQLYNELRGGDPYVIDGEGLCSAGFAVRGQSGQLGNGFVTAGHCALAGANATGIEGQQLGTFVAVAFPGLGTGEARDWAVVEVVDGWSLPPAVNDYQGGVLPVAGSVEAPVGASVCRYGVTTGYSCGVIQATNATVIYPEGTITGMTRTNACSEPGDSGGAWLSGDQAQGLTSGGSGDCSTGGITFFQPVNEVLARNELALVTTGGDKAPAEPIGGPGAPVSGCDDHAYLYRGEVTGPDYVRVEPGGTYYRALVAGTHTVCMATDGTGLQLVLQHWDGEEWQNVAVSEQPTASEQFSIGGVAGYYRIGVVSGDQVGAGYAVGLSFAP